MRAGGRRGTLLVCAATPATAVGTAFSSWLTCTGASAPCHRTRRAELRRAARQAVRLRRAQRGRQDDDDADRLRPARPRPRDGHVARAPARRQGAAADRLHARGARPVPQDARRRAARVLRGAARLDPCAGAQRGHGLAGAARPGRAGQRQDRGALAGQSAARAARRRARAPPGPAGAGRAVRRAGPDRHRRAGRRPARRGRARRAGPLLVAPARARRAHVRGGGHHRPRPARGVRTRGRAAGGRPTTRARRGARGPGLDRRPAGCEARRVRR
jgi:hypothetical protein